MLNFEWSGPDEASVRHLSVDAD